MVLMGERVLKLRLVYERLLLDTEFRNWLQKQKCEVKDKVRPSNLKPLVTLQH